MQYYLKIFIGAVLFTCAPFPALAAAANSPAIIIRGRAPAPDILGTVALPIRADRFDASVHKAFADASGSPLLQRLIAPARNLNRLQEIGYVQAAVNRSIRWVSDATEWGQHDYWASASETLAHGAGDMEDRAIVKMQALRALGFNQSDLFLTLARDRVGGPITVLMARVNGRYFVLDDTGGTPFPVDQRRFEFQPVLSFSWAGAWVHTRPSVMPRMTATTASIFAHK